MTKKHNENIERIQLDSLGKAKAKEENKTKMITDQLLEMIYSITLSSLFNCDGDFRSDALYEIQCIIEDQFENEVLREAIENGQPMTRYLDAIQGMLSFHGWQAGCTPKEGSSEQILLTRGAAAKKKFLENRKKEFSDE